MPEYSSARFPMIQPRMEDCSIGQSPLISIPAKHLFSAFHTARNGPTLGSSMREHRVDDPRYVTPRRGRLFPHNSMYRPVTAIRGGWEVQEPPPKCESRTIALDSAFSPIAAAKKSNKFATEKISLQRFRPIPCRVRGRWTEYHFEENKARRRHEHRRKIRYPAR